MALANWFAWMQNPDGSASEAFLQWIGNITPGGTNAPQNVQATSDRPDDVLVTWNPVGGATFYQVFRGVQADTATMTLLPAGSAVSGTTFTDTTAAAGTQYFYSVKASTSVGLSPFSGIAAGRRAVAPPGGGGGPSVVDVSTGLVTSITVPAGATKMKIEMFCKGGNGGGPGVQFSGGMQSAVGTGGGGASGAFWSIEDITVAAGQVMNLAAATNATANPRNDCFVTRVGDGQTARLTFAPNQVGGDAQWVGPGQPVFAGLAGQPATNTTVSNTFAGINEVFTPGNPGSAGSATSGAAAPGGAALVVDGRSAGAGAFGSSQLSGTGPVHIAGQNGRVVLHFT